MASTHAVEAEARRPAGARSDSRRVREQRADRTGEEGRLEGERQRLQSELESMREMGHDLARAHKELLDRATEIEKWLRETDASGPWIGAGRLRT